MTVDPQRAPGVDGALPGGAPEQSARAVAAPVLT